MKVLPDIMLQQSKLYQKLDWVGMTEIQLAMQVGQVTVPVALDVGVNLIEGHRGIHMSRLYQLQQSMLLNQKLSRQLLSDFNQKCLESQNEISHFISTKLKFHWPIATVSLKSGLPGFRQYPVQFIFELDKQGFRTWLQYEILYSSTCPQSASVSMEIIKTEVGANSFDHFPATPHAQRSRALMQIQLQNFDQAAIEKIILDSENCLGTPVQTTVKKVDEMEFARLNAENLMFCEDASRKLSLFLSKHQLCQGFRILCEHQESLHPHNATSVSAHNYSNPMALSFFN
jgi:GTP cyclohydrolase IB